MCISYIIYCVKCLPGSSFPQCLSMIPGGIKKSSKITQDKVCFCVNQEASTHQCELSWHGRLWMRALVTSSRWSWENGGQSLWEEGCDVQWRICPHLLSLLPPNVQSSPSVSGSLMKANTEDDFTIVNKDLIELWEVKKKYCTSNTFFLVHSESKILVLT